MQPIKRCTCCGKSLTRSEWNRLPPARGGLRAMEMEWRNCSACGSTLAVPLTQLEAA